ncbi:MAG: hypothetical protein A2Y77_16735 [Planctomycetes bacterium RBG_13_62_9]|nr:MAG: hypothetical protein A2Y77_16735 [Planctomycetes bacterium RBG_13_62_9]
MGFILHIMDIVLYPQQFPLYQTHALDAMKQACHALCKNSAAGDPMRNGFQGSDSHLQVECRTPAVIVRKPTAYVIASGGKRSAVIRVEIASPACAGAGLLLASQ